MRARRTLEGSARGAVVLRGHMGVPLPWGQRKGVPTSQALSGCPYMVPLTFPPCFYWLLCKKAMGCAGITRFHQDNEAFPG